MCVNRVNVSTTDARTGATALLLPAQNTHTLHDPIHVRDTEHARAHPGVLAALTTADRPLRMVWASAAMDGGGDVGNVCVPAPGGNVPIQTFQLSAGDAGPWTREMWDDGASCVFMAPQSVPVG
jgi:hypothetical protein